ASLRFFPYTTFFRSDLLDQRAGVRTDRGAPLDQPRRRPLEVRAVRGRPVFEHGAVLVLRVASGVARDALALEEELDRGGGGATPDRKSTRLNSSHVK